MDLRMRLLCFFQPLLKLLLQILHHKRMAGVSFVLAVRLNLLQLIYSCLELFLSLLKITLRLVPLRL